MPMTDQDTHNFSSSSPHRLPTLSASQALHNLSSTQRRPISTRLPTLDALLQGRGNGENLSGSPGGLSRAELTEVYGPPGVGKTTFAMQLAANALIMGGSVVWVDTTYNLVGSRFKDVLDGSSKDQSPGKTSLEEAPGKWLKKFHHYTVPTLPHLLALLTHPSESFPPPDTSLLVIDSVSTLFGLAFPKSNDDVGSNVTPMKKSDDAQWASSRRWAVMSDFTSKIAKLAVTKNIAILLISQTNTRIRSETGAVLHPAISSSAWDAGIGTRVVLFRDWLSQSHAQSNQERIVPSARFASVIKVKGISYEGVNSLVPFTIEKHGFQHIEIEQSEIPANVSPVLPIPSLKRKRGEIADSDSQEEGEAGSDQEFGWDADDETLDTGDVVERVSEPNEFTS